MNNIDKQYQDLLQDILDNGVEKNDRTGTGTISVFGRQIRHKMSEGFPLLTTKKMAFKTMVTELLWFLRGDTNIKYLVDNGCNIWNGDAYKNYKSSNPDFLANDEMSKTEEGTYKFFTQQEFINKIKTDDEFAKKWGELGPVYGRMWRAFDEDSYGGIDQIANLINDLKTNPDSRRLMVTAWHPGYNQHSVLPPCHYGFQCYVVDGKLSLMWNQRSVDTFLGLPFNIASYGTLLLLLCEETGYEPGELIANLGDVHLYKNHIEQAKEQIGREPYELPKLKMNPIFLANLEHKGFDEAVNGQVNFELENYQSHPSIKAPLSN